MKVIVPVDNSMGISFNGRRVSKDSAVYERAIRQAADHILLMNLPTYKEFAKIYKDPEKTEICRRVALGLDADFINFADEDDYCFVENINIDDKEKDIDTIILYKWNRNYPSDNKLGINLDNFVLVKQETFNGTSHLITEEIYMRDPPPEEEEEEEEYD